MKNSQDIGSHVFIVRRRSSDNVVVPLSNLAASTFLAKKEPSAMLEIERRDDARRPRAQSQDERRTDPSYLRSHSLHYLLLGGGSQCCSDLSLSPLVISGQSVEDEVRRQNSNFVWLSS